MRVDQWFVGWLDRHMDRHPRSDWPRRDEKPDFFRAWLGNFILHGITEEIADEASVRLVADPPKFLADHVPALIETARAIWRERAERGEGHAPDSREAAQRTSKDCDDCGGQGLTIRWRKLSLGTVGADGKPRSPSITLYCRCPMGRWLERSHREHAPDIRRRIYDLEEHPWLWGWEYRQPRGMLPAPAAEPAPAF